MSAAIRARENIAKNQRDEMNSESLQGRSRAVVRLQIKSGEKGFPGQAGDSEIKMVNIEEKVEEPQNETETIALNRTIQESEREHDSHH